MAILGMIYAEVPIFYLPGRSAKAFKLTKVAGAYWRETQKMRCSKEFMELDGLQKKI